MTRSEKKQIAKDIISIIVLTIAAVSAFYCAYAMGW
jgi:hypothetical protein